MSEGRFAPSYKLKNAFLKLNSRDLVHTVWQHFTKNPFILFYFIFFLW